MSLKPVATPPAGITCVDWESAGEPGFKRRCKYITREPVTKILQEGVPPEHLDRFVRLPDGRIWRGQCCVTNTKAVNPPGNRILCEEWLKIHPEDAMAARRKDPDPLPPTNLFGEFIQPAEKKPRGGAKATLVWEAPKNPPLAPWPIKDTTIDSLVKDGTEIRLDTGNGEMFVVPTHTELDRLEVTFNELSLIRSLVETFPGSTVRSISKNDPASAESGSGRRVFELVVSEQLIERLKRLNPATGLDREFEKGLGIYKEEKK